MVIYQMNRLIIRTPDDLVNVPRIDGVYNLVGADIRGANLQGADLRGAKLTGAKLNRAHLEGIHLEDADLRDADFKYAHLEGAFLSNTRLMGTDFRRAILNDADLQGSVITQTTKLVGGYFQRVNFSDVDLEGIKLARLHLEGAILRTNLAFANLRGAYLIDAKLERANLMGANLKDATLEGAFMDQFTNIYGVKLNRGTNLNRITSPNHIVTRLRIDQLHQTQPRRIGTRHVFELLGNTPEGQEELLELLVGENNNSDEDEVEEEHEGIAWEIHNNTNRIKFNNKFKKIIGADIDPLLTTIDLNKFESDFVDFINRTDRFIPPNTSDPNEIRNYKNDLIEKLRMVFTKLRTSPNMKNGMANLVNRGKNFAFEQDPIFTEAYITVFIDETTKAYNAECRDRMSCIRGIKERFYSCILGAALLVSTISGYDRTSKIQELICIAKGSKEQLNLTKLLQNWAEEWQNPKILKTSIGGGPKRKQPEIEKNGVWENMTAEERKNNLKNYLISHISRDDECYEYNKEDIINTIDKEINKYDYIFNNRESTAPEFGGSKRNKRFTRRKQNKKQKTRRSKR
jgi:uncharacterized protein YjbI with pentapeptide repeats